jgi:hypothetical protein
MIYATFQGGPLNGQTKELRGHEEPPLTMQWETPSNVTLDPAQMSCDVSSMHLSFVRYVLHFIDKRGVAHYYIPTTSPVAQLKADL